MNMAEGGVGKMFENSRLKLRSFVTQKEVQWHCDNLRILCQNAFSVKSEGVQAFSATIA